MKRFETVVRMVVYKAGPIAPDTWLTVFIIADPCGYKGLGTWFKPSVMIGAIVSPTPSVNPHKASSLLPLRYRLKCS